MLLKQAGNSNNMPVQSSECSHFSKTIIESQHHRHRSTQHLYWLDSRIQQIFKPRWVSISFFHSAAGEKTNWGSQMAGCVTWPQKSSSSSLPTQRRTSFPSPNSQMFLLLGECPLFPRPSCLFFTIPKPDVGWSVLTQRVCKPQMCVWI